MTVLIRRKASGAGESRQFALPRAWSREYVGADGAVVVGIEGPYVIIGPPGKEREIFDLLTKRKGGRR